MKILLDECIDQKLRFLFAEHDCQTAAYAKFAGLKNGVLLSAAEAADFELLITTDQEIPYQQNLDGRWILIQYSMRSHQPSDRSEAFGSSGTPFA